MIASIMLLLATSILVCRIRPAYGFDRCIALLSQPRNKKNLLVILILLPTSSFPQQGLAEVSAESCRVLLEGLDLPSKLMPVVERYWNNEEIKPIVEAISEVKHIDIYKPMRFFAKINESNNVLTIIINTIASPNAAVGPIWLHIVRLGPNATKGKRDFTVAKIIAGITRGIIQRKTINPNLKEVQILAPSLMNDKLATLLQAMGMKLSSKSLSFLKTGQLAVGSHQFLELDLVFP